TRLRPLVLIGALEQITAEAVEAPLADDTRTGGLEALSPIGLGRRRLLGLVDGGVAIEFVRVIVDDLRAVPGGEHDGVAVAVPAGESGRARSACLAGLEEVSGTTDEVVVRVGLELLDAFVDVDVVVLVLEILDLVGLLRNADVEFAAVGTVS